MKVFISWSGTRSKETAEVLSGWIRQVIQAAETWISLDIQKGIRWNDQIKNELEQSRVGIICLDKDNLQSEWVLFEAGALSKTQDAHVCTFLLDIKPADVKQPLGQFQHTLFNKEDIKKLVHTINNKIITVGEKTLPEKDLDEVFDVFYPKLDEKLLAIQNEKPVDGVVKRTDREILEEILQTIRSTKLEEINQLKDLFYQVTMKTRMENTELLNMLKHDYIAADEMKLKQYSERLLRTLSDNPELRKDKLREDNKKSEGDQNLE